MHSAIRLAVGSVTYLYAWICSHFPVIITLSTEITKLLIIKLECKLCVGKHVSPTFRAEKQTCDLYSLKNLY